MLFKAIASSLALAATTLAQTTPAGFTPATNQTLDVYYGSTYISPGLMVKKSSVASKPVIGVTGIEVSGKYLLAMIDIDVQAQGGGSGRTTVLHALLQDYTPSTQKQNGSTVLTTTANTPSSYFGPAPPAENPKHPHNYVFLLHKQPDGFAVPSAHRQAVSSRFGIDWNKFIVDAKLSPPIAGNYLQVQSGDNTLKGRKL
ncbi:PEBP-like protein [Aaosphaeria arxii CBS 175.79]|uniref:PEBP-like protein n=1 Tax=Aaosphaeria arxii CBS 175.79 TaxID=1450172 RepID=A0A6A5XSY5_9PLEO|nr:PEBP-like protein [Aaosphaeria arxii CBS 175.79]KAF2015861.1 PEBP-like protein [Aaosphaeria arxii CBS 175.79]